MERTTEFRVFGPPGTGKTTYLTKQVQNAAQKHGKENVIVASFTRTAAAELAGRGTGLPKSSINTLHGHSYAALGRKEIAENNVKQFNEENRAFAITDEKSADTEEMAIERTFKTMGDEYFSTYQLLRSRMTPRELYPSNVRTFADKWENFKRENDFIDFTDMIEIAYTDFDGAPYNAKIGFMDEVQDFTPLELALVRKWGKSMDFQVLAGDDDQTIYAFKGATPDAFLHPPLPENHVRILDQSYRMPIEVQKYAEKIISKVKIRQPKEYKPKDEIGSVRYLPNGNFKNPEPILRDAIKQIEAGKTVMFLTSCSYMVEPMKKKLKEWGIPFHNPYRVKRGDWNPLRKTGRGRSSVDRLLAFLRMSPEVYGKMAMMWRYDDVPLWTEHINGKNVLKHGAKKEINDTFEGDDEITIEKLMPFFHDEALMNLLSDNTLNHLLKWFQNHLLTTKKGPYDFPIKVLKEMGSEALKETPKIIIGTVHSVKGGQADVVYLIPDLSISGFKEYGDERKRDSITRLMYVGATRSAEELVICQNASPYTYKFPRM